MGHLSDLFFSNIVETMKEYRKSFAASIGGTAGISAVVQSFSILKNTNFNKCNNDLRFKYHRLGSVGQYGS
jgi:hypothetical protein